MLELLRTIYLFAVALVLAVLEIQIEGRYGWASRLPTWRPPANSLVTRIFARLMGGKQATGYHLVMFSFVLMLFHWPYLYGWPWTINNWFRTWSLFFSFVVVWDFLWFVCNPAYPLKYFQREVVKWHKHWWGRVPLDYLVGLLISWLFIVPLLFLNYSWEPLGWWLIVNSELILLTWLTVMITLFILHLNKTLNNN